MLLPVLHTRPVPHVLLAQHGWPLPPHATHVLLPPHVVPVAHAVPVAQHAWPGPPQAAHMPVPVLQLATPAVHVEFAQQGCPAAPQTRHEPPEHALPALQALPEQHG